MINWPPRPRKAQCYEKRKRMDEALKNPRYRKERAQKSVDKPIGKGETTHHN